MEFSGRLASFPIGDLLQWAHNDRRTGALVLRRSHSEKRVYFRDGEVVACFSDEAAEYFGQHLLVRGLVEEGALVRALTHCQQKGLPLGRSLEQLGILPREIVHEELRRHVEDQVCDLFLWKSGVFYFSHTNLPEEALLPQGIPAVQIAMEGSRWADEMGRIRKVFVHDNVIVRRGSLPPQRPTALQLRILRAADAPISLAELYTEVRGSFFRFLEGALRLAVAGALDVVDVRDHIDTSSTELRLADILIEQATEEEALRLRSQLAVPIEILQQHYPFWIGVSPREVTNGLPEHVRRIVGRIDGSITLGMLLANESREVRIKVVEWLLVQLEERRMGFLPVPAPRQLQKILS